MGLQFCLSCNHFNILFFLFPRMVEGSTIYCTWYLSLCSWIFDIIISSCMKMRFAAAEHILAGKCEKYKSNDAKDTYFI